METRTTQEAEETVEFSGPSKTAYTQNPEYIDDGSLPKTEFDIFRRGRMAAKVQLEDKIAMGSIVQVNLSSELPSS